MYNTDHYVALLTNLSNAKARLANATKPSEIAQRTVQVAQLEREVQGEVDFLASKGVSVQAGATNDLNDDALFAEISAALASPVPPAGGEVKPIGESTARLLHAFDTGEFNDEGGSPTVESLSCESFDGEEVEFDSYAAGYQRAVYEQCGPLLHMLTRLQAEVEQMRSRKDLCKEQRNEYMAELTKARERIAALEANHVAACAALVTKLGWSDYGVWYSGCLADGTYAHVCHVVV